MDTGVTVNDMAKKIAIGYEKPLIETFIDNRRKEIIEYIEEGANLEGIEIEGNPSKGDLVEMFTNLPTETKDILINDIGFNYNKDNYTSQVLEKLKNMGVNPLNFYYN